MTAIVLYSSKSGNTEKVAEAISSEINADLVKVSNPNFDENLDLLDYDLIFIGSGIRAGNPFSEMVSFLNTIELPVQKPFAIFLTWGGAGKTNQTCCSKLTKILQNKNQKIITSSFCCYGKWNMRKSSHPNTKEICEAKNWAKNVVESIHI